jgi:DNA-binding IclR family transcriptional regulator
MRALVDKLGATVHLATLDDGEVMYIDKMVPREGPVVSVSAVGKRLPPHSSAVGKVLLAHEPWAHSRDALERCGVQQYTDRTLSSVDALRSELTTVRQMGTARDRQETVEGVCCHAAPIFDGGCVVAAISVCVSSSADERFAERYRCVVRAAGIQVSRLLQRHTDEHVSHALAS